VTKEHLESVNFWANDMLVRQEGWLLTPRNHALMREKWTKFIPCIKFIMGLSKEKKLREEPSTDTKELRTVEGSLVEAEGIGGGVWANSRILG
jgi:hypothetical protein